LGWLYRLLLANSSCWVVCFGCRQLSVDAQWSFSPRWRGGVWGCSLNWHGLCFCPQARSVSSLATAGECNRTHIHTTSIEWVMCNFY